jgi:DNA-directed RNA polymerase subunit RPC12/RpoP
MMVNRGVEGWRCGSEVKDMGVEVLNCKNCGAPLEVAESPEIIRCRYCNAVLRVSREPNGAVDLYVGVDRAMPDEGSRSEPDSFLFNSQIPVWKYALVMAVISFVPSILLSFGLGAAGVMTEESGPKLGGFGPGIDFAMIVWLSPVVETLLMGVILKALSFISRRRYVLAAMSCGVWAGLHSLFSPAWGLVVFWPFFVFSCSYLAWRRRSWRHAVCVTSLIHMLHNLLPGLAIAVKGFTQ